jgi:hypothetical protein
MLKGRWSETIPGWWARTYIVTIARRRRETASCYELPEPNGAFDVDENWHG